jgi:putative oxygen-independent coproporphyrinogen III oxidase
LAKGFCFTLSLSCMQTLGLYVQVPFCSSKCSFCNFSSRVERVSAFDDYCRALDEEIERLPSFYEAHGIRRELLELPADTLYFGGGTPSLLGVERLTKIFRTLERRFQFRAPVEVTLEVTPGSLETGFLEAAQGLGINRLSIGAQSFEDRELRAVGRLHSASQTAELICHARRAGLQNISLDLIAGLPYQTEASWFSSLRAAANLRPTHLSLYLFEIDEKSRLGREVLQGGRRYHASAVRGDEFMAEAYETGRAFLDQEGYQQYEISNFAQPGCESRHNLKYWRLDPYAGFGAGAHSFDGACRWANEEDPQSYERRLALGLSPIADIRTLSPEQKLEEFFFLGLRRRQGVDLTAARQQWGRDRLRRWETTVETLVEEGWLERAGNTLRLTERSFLVSNEIFQQFVGL